ncbi:MAG: efflux RND transporter periplasmic adaptor subunit [Planctomycetota bacterium]|jgi:multidrug efflux pump subunit AcrA (membrane-fusion protein)
MKNRKRIVLTVVISVAAFVLVISRLGSDHDHEHEEEKSSQVTVWGERFEIFLEHPFIVVDTPTKFITHVSDLVTLEPRRKGPVTFVLRHGSETPIEHVEQAPARDGIYIPEFTFPKSGKWDVSLVIGPGGKDHIINLPLFEVYGSHEEADRAPSQEIAGISFLKEQQWEILTSTEPVRKRKVSDSEVLVVPESSLVDEDGIPTVFVQAAGETFQKRSLTIGGRANGFVEVLSGLSEGEYVTTKGAHAVARAEHGEESAVHISDEQIRKYGIETSPAETGDFSVHISLPGQIAINTDRMAHIVPNAAGVVRQVLKNVGDTVKAGEILAWLESAELGKAKVDYLTKLAEVGCCSMELTRTKLIHDSTMKLLQTLQSDPPVDSLNQISGAALDKNHTALVSSYAELALAKSTYEREKSLFEQEISSEQDYLTAESAFKKSESKYAALRDSITFELQKNLIDAQRDQQVRLIGLKGAERSLYVLGLTAEDINDIRLLGQAQSPASENVEVCTDPNCTDCAKPSPNGGTSAIAKSSEENEKLAWYPLRAPFDAAVIEKHITLGERLSSDSDAFTVADISTVWVNLSVHQKDLHLVKPGQQARITVGPAVPKVEGTISFVSPVVTQNSRTTLARVVLDNKSGQLRPGTFVTADVVVEKVPAKVTVARDILQDIDDMTCVFVKHEHCFEARPVTVGRSNEKYVEIVSGIRAGEKIVTKNSFRLKAELEKAAGSGHAGHGHAH